MPCARTHSCCFLSAHILLGVFKSTKCYLPTHHRVTLRCSEVLFSFHVMLQWFGPFEAPFSNSKWKVLCFGPPTAHRHLSRAHKWVMAGAVGNNTRTWQICPSNIHYIVSNQKHHSWKKDGLNNEPRFLQHWLFACQSKFAHCGSVWPEF